MLRQGLSGEEIADAILAQPVERVTYIEGIWISGYDTINLTMADGSIISLGAGGEDHGIQVELVTYQ